MTYTSEFMRRINTLGPKNGACNICGEEGPLTEDHVPPKGVHGGGHFNLFRLHDLFGVEKLPRKSSQFRSFQSGVKYRTLCATCNTCRLGGEYDPSLISLANQMVTIIQSPSPPRASWIRVDAARVVRAIVGHILAIGVGRSPSGPAGEGMRDFFLDPTAPCPPQLEAYVWAYPSRRQVLVRNAGRSAFDAQIEAFHFSLLKFYPCALMLTWQNTGGFFKSSLGCLTDHKEASLDELVEVRLPLRRVPRLDWPELVAGDDTAFILHMDDAGVAMPRK